MSKGERSRALFRPRRGATAPSLRFFFSPPRATPHRCRFPTYLRRGLTGCVICDKRTPQNTLDKHRKAGDAGLDCPRLLATVWRVEAVEGVVVIRYCGRRRCHGSRGGGAGGVSVPFFDVSKALLLQRTGEFVEEGVIDETMAWECGRGRLRRTSSPERGEECKEGG